MTNEWEQAASEVRDYLSLTGLRAESWDKGNGRGSCQQDADYMYAAMTNGWYSPAQRIENDTAGYEYEMLREGLYTYKY